MRNLTNNTSLEDIIYDLRNEDNKEDLALWLENNVEEKSNQYVYDQGYDDGYDTKVQKEKQL